MPWLCICGPLDSHASNSYTCPRLKSVPEMSPDFNKFPDCFGFHFLVLFLHFRRKTRLIKWASACVCLCVCLCVCVCVSVYNFGPPPNNFQTTYPIDTKFFLHIVSYRNSPTQLIPFLNFENCAREKFLKFIFSPFK